MRIASMPQRRFGSPPHGASVAPSASPSVDAFPPEQEPDDAAGNLTHGGEAAARPDGTCPSASFPRRRESRDAAGNLTHGGEASARPEGTCASRWLGGLLRVAGRSASQAFAPLAMPFRLCGNDALRGRTRNALPLREGDTAYHAGSRDGFSLLELIFALVIFVGAAAAISQLVLIGLENSEYTQYEVEGWCIAESRLSDLAAGVLAMESAAATDEFNGNWEWQVELVETGQPYLYQATATARRLAEPNAGFTVEQTRLIFDETAAQDAADEDEEDPLADLLSQDAPSPSGRESGAIALRHSVDSAACGRSVGQALACLAGDFRGTVRPAAAVPRRPRAFLTLSRLRGNDAPCGGCAAGDPA